MRTMALDPGTHKSYLAAGKYEAAAPTEGHHRKILPFADPSPLTRDCMRDIQTDLV